MTLDISAYAAQLARRIESTGADVLGPRITYVTGQLVADVSITAELPGSGFPRNSEMRLSERWSRPYLDQPWRLAEYAYELLDYERHARLALHLHDKAWFVDTYNIVVHEHCEAPIGDVHCRHYAGPPVSDSFDAVDRMLETWMDDRAPDCTAKTCLDEMKPGR